MSHVTFQKPLRGTALVEARMRRRERVDAEQKEMQAAKRRDGNVCRNPGCTKRTLELPIDPAHQVHRGMGGNPKGDRTTRASVIALCRICHGLWDDNQIEIEPLTSAGFDGPAEFRFKHPETGRMETRYVETRIGVSEERGA